MIKVHALQLNYHSKLKSRARQGEHHNSLPAPQKLDTRKMIPWAQWLRGAWATQRLCDYLACSLAFVIFSFSFNQTSSVSENFLRESFVKVFICLPYIYIMMLFNLFLISRKHFTFYSHTSLANRPSIIFHHVGCILQNYFIYENLKNYLDTWPQNSSCY